VKNLWTGIRPVWRIVFWVLRFGWRRFAAVVRWVKRVWVPLLGTVGPLLTAQTLVWEYARMRPTYGFIVKPWSIRGYETTHGWISLAIGFVALLAFWAVRSHRSEQLRYGAAIVSGVVAAGTIITAAFGGGEYSVTPGFPVIGLLTLILGTETYRLVGSISAGRGPMRRSWVRALVLIGLLAGVAAGLNATIGGREVSVPQWVAMGVVLALAGALSLASAPRQLSANRMLMLSSIVAGLTLALSAGAVRSTLRRFQVAEGGVPAKFIDTQVTAGHLLAVLGMALLFAAAVALWARRRDTLLTAQRAKRQRDAAEASASEIRAALEHVGR